jgi:TPR repeat protein
MRIRYSKTLPCIFLVFLFFDPNVRAQKTPAIPDPTEQEIMAAAVKGDPRAQVALGSKYIDRKNYTEAVKWFRKAAEQGNTNSQMQLGSLYYIGEGVPQDYAESMKWYRKAAEQGDAAAQLILGHMYDNKPGVPPDYAEALKWFRKAAEQGNAEAQSRLARMYHTGKGIPRDYAEALKWYRKADEQGNTTAQSMLGLMYSRGQGVPQDWGETIKWYRKAAEQGDVLAQVQIAQLYNKGEGVPQNYAEALKWYRKAAERGDDVAQSNLGLIYEHGQGVPQDFAEAYKWYNLAASQGSKWDSLNRDNLASKMTPEQIAEGQRRSSAFVPRKGSPRQSDQAEAVMSSDTPKFSGSGFIISQDGYLLTNYHVVEDASKIMVQIRRESFPARVVKADAANDIALLKVTGSFQLLPISTSRSVKLGDAVFTIGFPNIDVQGVEPKLTKGDISSLGGIQDDPRYFQVSLPIQPGNSGGPLVNRYGNVIGIISAKLDDLATLKTTGSLPQNVGYALKSSLMNAFLETIPEIAPKLKGPNTDINRKFEDLVKEAQSAVALILVY